RQWRVDQLDRVNSASKGTASVKDGATLALKFQEAIQNRLKELAKLSDENAIETIVKSVEFELSQAIEKRDVDTILKLVPGKQLLRQLIKITGFQSENVWANAVAHHLSPDTFPIVSALREKLVSRLS
ncbi:hypothetical protein, partial [Collimonas fungivorans]|uniref:hypothetical protein n=1 Tax=Collimonas fungivorans TaxID=158899 RepID=UPI003FA3875C